MLQWVPVPPCILLPVRIENRASTKLRRKAPSNQRMKLAAGGGRLKGNESVLIAAAAGRSLCAGR